MKFKKIPLLFTIAFTITSLFGCQSKGKESEAKESEAEVHQHVFVDHAAKEATCEEDGNIAYAECSECHKLFSSDHKTEIESYIIEKTGHDLTHHQETCENIEYWNCVKCNKNFLDENATNPATNISRNGHIFVDIPAKEATCFENGNIAYSRCTVCGKLFECDHLTPLDGSPVVPKVPHQMTHHEETLFDNIEYWSCSICHKNYADEDGTEEIGDVSKPQHNLLGNNLVRYLSAETEEEIVAALQGSRYPFNDQNKKIIWWDNKGASSYVIQLSTDANFTTYKTYSSNKNTFTLPGTLLPGTKYYYRVFDDNNALVVELNGFKTDGTFPVRNLHVEGVSNVRDIGGWMAKDGHKVLYNKIIRGGRLSGITAAGKDVFFDELGIKTELDLRTDGTSDLSGDSRLTNYIKSGMNQYTMLVPNYSSPQVEGREAGVRFNYDSSTPAALKKTFEVLANPNNYPIYYHCNAGADRTGSLTYLVNGLLGVSYEDLTKDFELTTFSAQGNRFRSKIEDGHFVSEGEMAGIYECDTDNYVAWGKLNELISTNYAQPNGQLCSAIEYYLIKECGISNETIQAVRRNLLGEDVEFDPVEIAVDTTFNMENGNWTLNDQMTYEKGTYFGKDAYKFTAYSPANQLVDHYIFNNLSLITDSKYTKFHFEMYIPSESAKWYTHQGKDEGERMLISIKPMEGSTSYVRYDESYVDKWSECEINISSYTALKRFAFYLPYGSPETPSIVYLRNVYVD